MPRSLFPNAISAPRRRRRPIASYYCGGAIIAATILLAVPVLLNAASPHVARAAPKGAVEQDEPSEPPPAELVAMTGAHRALRSFSGVITMTYGEKRRVTATLAFRRPNRLRALVVETISGKTASGGTSEVYVDGKTVYARYKNKWTRRPLARNDDLFRVYEEIVEEPWASKVFHDPDVFNDPYSKGVSYTVEARTLKKGVRATYLYANYMDSMASVGYEVSYLIGKKDKLLRKRTYETSASSPLHSWDESRRALAYSGVRVNPVLADSRFAPPPAARNAKRVSADAPVK